MQRRAAFVTARIFFICGMTYFSAVPAWAQSARPDSATTVGSEAARIPVADVQSLTNRIKDVESPALRAYLYLRLSAWLWKSAGEDHVLRRAAADAAASGVSDIHKHERAIPPASASRFYKELLQVVRQHSAEEAARLERVYPLQLIANSTEEEKSGAALNQVLAKLDTPRDVERAARIIASRKVSPMTLQGALFRLDQAQSPALPQLLGAALALEENSTGALPLQNMFFMSHLYLKDAVPAELQVRFLTAAFKATRVSPAELRSDPAAFSWAVQLLQRALPFMQKHKLPFHAEAAAQLALLAPNAPEVEAVAQRIRGSSDPLAQTISEANSAKDEPLKAELFKSAAQLAKQQGKLRLAAELMTSVEEDRRGLPEEYSGRDEFLEGVVREAVAQKDLETARYVSSKVTRPGYLAGSLQRIARYYVEQNDVTRAAETLEEAVRRLKDVPDGTVKAVAYLRLVTEFADLDSARAFEITREAVRAANSISRPSEDGGGKSGSALLPVAENTIRTFNTLAQKDSLVALQLADTFQPKEFKVAAALGVYSSAQK